MMRLSCPACQRCHRKFPRACFYAAHSDFVHVVIAKLASHGTPTQVDFDAKARVAWTLMQAYVVAVFPNDPALKGFEIPSS